MRLALLDFPLEQQEALKAFDSAKAMARSMAESQPSNKRLALSRAFCESVLKHYWRVVCDARGCNWRIRPSPIESTPLNSAASALAASAGEKLATLPSPWAGYLIGVLYTATLPEDLRSRWGAYYTPPGLVDRLLKMSEQAGIDWTKSTAIDPACGGGAFLAPVALRMWQCTRDGSPELILKNISARLCGVEIDPFAAWMSHVLLESALLPLCIQARKRMPDIILVTDALKVSIGKEFDLVVGNPPYGRISLSPEMRQLYARSLYGHANLYGLFTDLAVRLTKTNGVIAYVTPTSFLGGQYFKSLRQLLSEKARPCIMDFVADREGVFDDVLQETMLAVFSRGQDRRKKVTLHFLEPDDSTGPVKVKKAGEFSIEEISAPWVLPRHSEQVGLVPKLNKMRCRLTDYGYAVSTGPLVWNRHKTQLREHQEGPNLFPLVWAESVTVDGRFSFSAAKRNHAPSIELDEDQGFLITRGPCVLVQRTTAKEQSRRLIAAMMPADFIVRHGGAVVENHLNMVRQIVPGPIFPETICALLNSRAADQAYRCISGSVAVSAYELESLPVPDERQMLSLQRLVKGGASRELIEGAIGKMYENSR